MPLLRILETPNILAPVSWTDLVQDSATVVEESRTAGEARNRWLLRWTVGNQSQETVPSLGSPKSPEKNELFLTLYFRSCWGSPF